MNFRTVWSVDSATGWPDVVGFLQRSNEICWDDASELLAAVEHGEQVTITRRGRPIVRIIAATETPESGQIQRRRVLGTFARLRELRKGIRLGMDVSDAIDEGRD